MKSGSGWVCFNGAGVRFLASREIGLTLPRGKWRETRRQERGSSERSQGQKSKFLGAGREVGIRKDNGPDGSCGVEGLWSEIEVSSPGSEDLLPPSRGVPATSGLGPPGSTRLTLKLINYKSLKKKFQAFWQFWIMSLLRLGDLYHTSSFMGKFVRVFCNNNSIL